MQKLTKGKIIGMLIGVAIAAWIGNRASEFVRALLAQGRTSQDYIGEFMEFVKADPLALSAHETDLTTATVCAVAVLLVVFYNLASRKPTRPGEEQGSAGWATPKQLAKYGDKQPARRIQLVQGVGMSMDGHKTQRNNNVTVIGGSGSGKTRSYVMPNITTLECSTATTDPKGEIRAKAEPILTERGVAVRVFNLVDLRNSHGFNPLRYVDEEAPETSIAQLAEGIVMNTSGSKDGPGKDAFWDRAERALLTALIAYVWATTPDTADHEASLADVVDLHKRMASGEGKAATVQSEVDLEMQAAREVVAEYHADPPRLPADLTGEAREAEERRLKIEARAMRVLDFATRQYRIYEQGPGETKMSIIISLGVRLSPLDMWEVRQIISRDTIALDRIGMEPTALFLELPDTHGTFNFLAALFWQCLFEKNIYIADHSEPRGLRVPVHCFLDEFANLGMIPNFERVIATIRSRGISVSVIVQAMSQGKAVWLDHWPTIVGNCDSVLFLGAMDLETREWISKQLGTETVIEEDFSKSYGASKGGSRSTRTVKRDLMTPDEVGRLSTDEAIVMIRGERPLKARKAKALK
ncbi:VirD4-like conjugal transfer protein, CD1115 family [Micrococcus luteus]|uniref:VirD4-like conjugal transfer protein, CD1115 family n=1 Tax=Micrococcus luteus TaxID=1270 RepID=UPI0033BBC07E